MDTSNTKDKAIAAEGHPARENAERGAPATDHVGDGPAKENTIRKRWTGPYLDSADPDAFADALKKACLRAETIGYVGATAPRDAGDANKIIADVTGGCALMSARALPKRFQCGLCEKWFDTQLSPDTDALGPLATHIFDEHGLDSATITADEGWSTVLKKIASVSGDGVVTPMLDARQHFAPQRPDLDAATPDSRTVGPVMLEAAIPDEHGTSKQVRVAVGLGPGRDPPEDATEAIVAIVGAWDDVADAHAAFDRESGGASRDTLELQARKALRELYRSIDEAEALKPPENERESVAPFWPFDSIRRISAARKIDGVLPDNISLFPLRDSIEAAREALGLLDLAYELTVPSVVRDLQARGFTVSRDGKPLPVAA